MYLQFVLYNILYNILAYIKRHDKLGCITDVIFYLLPALNGMFVYVTTYYFQTLFCISIIQSVNGNEPRFCACVIPRFI
jgi:hypothetical protein